jgi:hypothetical protein
MANSSFLKCTKCGQLYETYDHHACPGADVIEGTVQTAPHFEPTDAWLITVRERHPRYATVTWAQLGDDVQLTEHQTLISKKQLYVKEDE